MLKYSRQRECILNNLRSRTDHPTADMVYESVRMEQPNISLGTVYRNLSLLAENGVVLKLSTKVGPDRFDGNVNPHIHFVCRKCGRVLDMGDVPQVNLIEMADPQFDGEIEGCELQYFGICGACLQ